MPKNSNLFDFLASLNWYKIVVYFLVGIAAVIAAIIALFVKTV